MRRKTRAQIMAQPIAVLTAVDTPVCPPHHWDVNRARWTCFKCGATKTTAHPVQQRRNRHLHDDDDRP